MQGDTVSVAADAKPGTRLWVKGEAGGKVGWATVQVAPLVEMTLRPDAARLPDGTVDVYLSGKITRRPPPSKSQRCSLPRRSGSTTAPGDGARAARVRATARLQAALRNSLGRGAGDGAPRLVTVQLPES